MAISHRCSNSIVSSDIRRMFEGKWDWTELSRGIPLVEVRRYPHLPWDIDALSHNPTLTVHDIQSLQIKDGEWSWSEMTNVLPSAKARENLDLSHVISDILGLPLDNEGLLENLSLELHDMKYLLQDVDGWQDWNWISSVVPIIDVYTHSNLKWNRAGLSRNKDIRVGDLMAWNEIPPSIYKRWQYPTDVVIV